MKHGKVKILFSLMCLIAALALAVFTVYAWFFNVENVKTNGIDAVITTGDVIDFEITYYYTTSEDSQTYTRGKKIEPSSWPEETTESDKRFKIMKDYSPRAVTDHSTDTAVLIDIKITFSSTADGSYPLKANVPHSDVYNINDFTEFTEQNYLSNVVYIQRVTGSGNTYSLTGNQMSFVKDTFDGDDDGKKIESSIQLYTHTVGAKTAQLYFIMDYKPEQIMALYTIMLTAKHDSFKAATLTTKIRFLEDITFEIGKA